MKQKDSFWSVGGSVKLYTYIYSISFTWVKYRTNQKIVFIALLEGQCNSRQCWQNILISYIAELFFFWVAQLSSFRKFLVKTTTGIVRGVRSALFLLTLVFEESYFSKYSFPVADTFFLWPRDDIWTVRDKIVVFLRMSDALDGHEDRRNVSGGFHPGFEGRWRMVVREMGVVPPPPLPLAMADEADG